ncbi:MAG TPA: hypothetical protein VK986_18455, partial [Tepidisphaeraceae bacterium]|nr:hypothetical protein [Tepidisphaeraceae bacterium]
MKRRFLSAMATAAAMAVAGESARAAAVTGTIFDPDGGGYTSLGAQNFSAGVLTFDTTNLTLTHDTLGLIGSGSADTSASGQVQMAVFNFDSLSIGGGVTVNVTGNLGLALTSRTDLTVATAIGVNGTAGSFGAADGQAGGAGGSGAEGGVRNSG